MNRESNLKQLVQAVKDHGSLDDAEIIQAAECGPDPGFNGFACNFDGVAFCDRHIDLIWGLLADQSIDSGQSSPLKSMVMFHRHDMAWTFDGFKTLLAWFALEEASRFLDKQREAGADRQENSS